MIPIRSIARKELQLKCVDLLSKTYIELGQKPDHETIVVLATSLADDLKRTYKNFYYEDAENAFRLGVRAPIKSDFVHLNVQTYMRWLRKHKELIWNARHEVEEMGKNPNEIAYYREEPKLLN
tara:strand:- start:1708 stop:2076 length:369 start_codon:yes stop_codon:yes gene_type:complete